MDRDKLRNYFKSQRQLIRDLRTELEERAYYQEEAISRAEHRAIEARNRADRERQDMERQAECERWDREAELRKATDNLDRAIRYGDEWGISRAREELNKIARR